MSSIEASTAMMALLIVFSGWRPLTVSRRLVEGVVRSSDDQGGVLVVPP